MLVSIQRRSIGKLPVKSIENGMSVYGGKMTRLSNFSIEYFAESDPATILPELLDRLIALGEMARQISHALGNNGHRPEVAAELIEYLKHQADK